ncbi:helix-turn-helix domain-containing protein [uncultured Mitsuokella sp.]|uniref:helix-turn-helix domain-containing protein n=1 Tax=uncultured Mitsuokella sp. TaxID=453120 RepID=UPI0025951921|nr:helix-turn-helix transcriptional regulator [uncultured Mitsuokella sp.]
MNRIKELRVTKGLTQEELGNILNVQKAAISKYENGRAEPSVDILRKMTSFFKVSSDYLLGMSELVQPPATPASTPPLSPQEQDLLRKYRVLTPNSRAAVDAVLDTCYNNDKPKTEDAAT